MGQPCPLRDIDCVRGICPDGRVMSSACFMHGAGCVVCLANMVTVQWLHCLWHHTFEWEQVVACLDGLTIWHYNWQVIGLDHPSNTTSMFMWLLPVVHLHVMLTMKTVQTHLIVF